MMNVAPDQRHSLFLRLAHPVAGRQLRVALRITIAVCALWSVGGGIAFWMTARALNEERVAEAARRAQIAQLGSALARKRQDAATRIPSWWDNGAAGAASGAIKGAFGSSAPAPDEPGTELASTLSRLAGRSGVAVLSLRFENDAPKNGSPSVAAPPAAVAAPAVQESVRFSSEISGSFTGLIGLFDALAAAPRSIDIVSVKIARGSNSGAAPAVPGIPLQMNLSGAVAPGP